MVNRASSDWFTRLWWAVFSVALLALVIWQGLAFSGGNRYWQDLWLTRDQQGQWYFNHGDFRQAAQRFDDPQWRAVAMYASEAFAGAATLWQRQTGVQPLFNQANALAHQEEYQAAADYYQLVLQWLKDEQDGPVWQATRDNLELVEVLGREPEKNYDRNSEAQLDPDEVVFDKDTDQQEPQDDETELGEGGMSSEEIQALWMRQLQTKPVDFLRLKFQYQLQVDGEQTGQETPP